MEQVFHLEAYATNYNLDSKPVFIWAKTGAQIRDQVPPYFHCEHVNIVEEHAATAMLASNDYRILSISEILSDIQSIRIAAKNIIPSFSISLPADTLGLHLRGGDRINQKKTSTFHEQL